MERFGIQLTEEQNLIYEMAKNFGVDKLSRTRNNGTVRKNFQKMN